MSYVLLCLLFLVIATAVTGYALTRTSDARGLVRRWWKSWALTLSIVLALTAVFDNVMIMVGLMEYAGQHISGLRIGLAPIEDFSYPLAAAILLPGLWLLLTDKGQDGR
ncbi:lycopene cyclase domain-containing protein [Acaricomes phytoseiuli]|uniref:lycopene cyclase domain-containing protein n=1 Tax=Acaricomes phytoseiuli TaxID=291968 RepID=UPI00035EF9BE|nr:lycopene cyclase domain-containing protein [Acaricomes phytoseiuli]MCW1248677.1 lycopene cyclase domain-containing protein [Acaricomes phytoseiuli]